MMDRDVVIWDTTAPRHLSVAGRMDVLVGPLGLHVPRDVANPADPFEEELLSGPRHTLSEIAHAEARFRARHRDSPSRDDFEAAEQLAAFRRSPDLRVIDLDDSERDDAEVFSSLAFAERHDLVAPLGKGEAAVLALASSRGCRAGLDETVARQVARELDVTVVTTRQWLREQVEGLRLSKAEANTLYEELRIGGFRAKENLY